MLKSKDSRPGVAAEEIRVQMAEFCMDENKLHDFYKLQVRLLPPAPIPIDEPPPLAI